MSTSELYYSTESDTIGTFYARFGIAYGRSNGRTVIYTKEEIPLEAPWDVQNVQETTFIDSYEGVFAISCTINPLALKVVEALEGYTEHPYDRYIGIRLAVSDRPDYASKLVIHLSRESDVSDVCAELAKILHDRYTTISCTEITDERPSEDERRDLLDYTLVGDLWS